MGAAISFPTTPTLHPEPMRTAPTLLVLIAAGAFGGFAATTLVAGLPQAQASPATVATPTMAALPGSVDGQPLPSLAPMLKRVMPSVVSVHTKQRVRVSPFGGDPFFRRMFPELSQERINESLGSGVIVDAQRGYVLTNHHVIEGADDVSVTLADGRTLKAEFLGSDADTDVALMRIPAENLTAIALARNDTLEVGDFVVAVGNPFGFSQTVTSGIVSAVGRSGIRGLGYQNFIQTDASINPGNSGGALVNLKGELVGINTASFNPRGSAAGNIGLGLAIPVDLAHDVMNQLLTTGEVRRGTLGVETQDVTERLARALQLDSARGALVTRLLPNSAAAVAGLQAQDVIVAANGQRIDNSEALRNFQGLQSPNAQVTLDVRRDGKPLQLTATLREQPRAMEGLALDPRLAGATLAELPEAVRRNRQVSGVLVEKVEPGSRAEKSGLRQGDVVVGVSGGRVGDLATLLAGLSERPQQLVLHIRRGGAQGSLQMQ